MNIVYITQEIFLSFIKKAETYTQFGGLKNLLKALLWKMDLKALLLNFKSYDYTLRFKSLGVYLFNASVEGIKQNLFGPDINMEFAVLTMRAWVILAAGFIVSFPAYLTGRYSAKRNDSAKCPDYSRPNAPFKLCLQ
jgi:hypothetical protein